MLTDLQCAELCHAVYNGDYTVSSVAGVDYIIRSDDDCSVIVFEGSHDVPDWLSNFKAEMIHIPGVGGVEKGFYDGLPETLIAAMPLLPKDKPVYVIGHSRGAGHVHIFARMLINAGYEAKNVIRVAFASPNPGDAELAAGLVDSPCHSYRNYRSMLEQDFVCIVPEPIPLIAPYMHPGARIIFDVPPQSGDPWLILARHHLFLYIQGLKALCN